MGNCVEVMIGYFMKYGDQVVDCNFIGNFYKQQVCQLVVYVGVLEDFVLQMFFVEMWFGQIDEGEFGFMYDVLDVIFVFYVDGLFLKFVMVCYFGVIEEQVDCVVGFVEGSVYKWLMLFVLLVFDVQVVVVLLIS